MKRILLSFTACALLGITSFAQTGDEIINKHIEAMGGEQNLNKINSLKFTGAINAQGMEFPTSQTMLNNKGLRMDFSVMGMDCYVVMNQKDGWMYIPVQPGMDKVTPMPADQLKQAQSKLNIKNMWLAEKSMIAKAVLNGRDTINNIPCLKVTVTDKAGFEQVAYFEEATYYLIRTELKVQNKDEEQEVSVTFNDFQKLPEGVVIPMKRTDPMMGGDVIYKTVEINKPVSEDMFKPDYVKKNTESDAAGSKTKQ